MKKLLSHRKAAASVALAMGAVIVGASAAAAATLPTYTDTNSLGGFKLFDPSGNFIITGASNVPVPQAIGKVVADAVSPTAYDGDGADGESVYEGNLAIYSPTSGSDQSADGGVPIGAVQVEAHPAQPYVVPISQETKSIETLVSVLTPSASGFYQLRLLLLNDQDGLSSQYFTADITVDTTLHTFTVVREGSGVPTPPITTNPTLPEAPLALLLPLTAGALGAGTVVVRRRRNAARPTIAA